ncbi:MFS transporter [Actinomycetospora termitidis]|uniref:MFS transporter n=1 Tax=Actinomycetospora termitidis TaxID=3053470 RepID=A0ABT7M2L3_9PSEU|nr:MFS transporter [Actinomycetospora sp. Odt1-22]MDL5154895.1 MFS transporter [Actinomycetospora sp. Odt1-22]
MANDPRDGARHRWLVLAICCTSLLVVSMDNTIVNVALPVIRTDLAASITELQWTVDAYTLVLACFLMLAGATGDRVGRRRTFQVGLAVFGLGSLLCSLAPSVGWLIAARAVQGAGGTMLNPIALSIVTNVFVDPRERARAIGIWGSVVGIALGLGPVLGGVLTEAVGWRAIFWVNVPVVLAAIVLTARFVPESRAAHARRADPVGQVLVVVLLGSLTTAVIEAPRLGWTSGLILGLGGAALVALVALLAWERRRREPLLELGFFASVPFSGATVVAVCAFAAFGSFLFLSTLYLQDVRGLSALGAGLMLLPAAVTATVCAPLSGRLVGTRGSRPSLVGAGIAMTAVAVLLTQVGPTTPTPVLLVAFGVFGIGFGLVNPPITNTAVSGMPRAQAGVAAAVASTSRQVGQTFGVAVSGTVVAATVSLGVGLPRAWAVVVFATAVVGVVGVVATTARARASAERVAARFADEPVPAAA